MSNKTYERKQKESKPVVAICYDFDKTLSPDDMQAQGYIQSLGYDIKDFWTRSNLLAVDNEMDQNLAYMYTMKEEARGNIVFTKKKLKEYGEQVKLFSGVEEWFGRINKYGEEQGVIVEHYIISSGLKEMIEGTSIADKFEKIYACSFIYNDKGEAIWPAQVVNYTNKTQFLFRIEKGTLDVNDPAVNDFFEPDEIRVPFRNMIYIGDSDTDVPCMKLVNLHNGHSIGVYNPASQNKNKVYKMMKDKRIKYFVPADYTENSDLDILVKTIIDRTVQNEKLEEIYYKNNKETMDYFNKENPEEMKKEYLIYSLKNSRSFAETHSVISKLIECEKWTKEQQEQLCIIAMKNQQVRWIILDEDVKLFYEHLIKNYSGNSQDIQEVTKLISEI